MCLSNCKTMRWFELSISWLRDFRGSQNKTSFRILKRGPVGGVEDAWIKMILSCACRHFYQDVVYNEPISLFLCFNTWNFEFLCGISIFARNIFTMHLVRNKLINECSQTVQQAARHFWRTIDVATKNLYLCMKSLLSVFFVMCLLNFENEIWFYWARIQSLTVAGYVEKSDAIVSI